MDDLIQRISTNVGIDPATATKAVGMILAFLLQEGPKDKVHDMMKAIPGADAMVAAQGDTGGGMLGNLMGNGIMGLGSKLMGLGLGMGEISGVAKETMAYARENGQGDAVDDVVGSIPGLSQFV